MRTVLRVYGSALKLIGKIELGIGIGLLSGIVGCIFAQVLSRYGLGRPLVWVEELSTYFFIWGTFIGASYALKQARHIRILTLVDRMHPVGRKSLALFAYMGIIFFLVFGIIYGIRQMSLEAALHTIALPIRLPRKYFYSLPFLLAFISMLITSIHFLLEEADKLIRKE